MRHGTQRLQALAHELADRLGEEQSTVATMRADLESEQQCAAVEPMTDYQAGVVGLAYDAMRRKYEVSLADQRKSLTSIIGDLDTTIAGGQELLATVDAAEAEGHRVDGSQAAIAAFQSAVSEAQQQKKQALADDADLLASAEELLALGEAIVDDASNESLAPPTPALASLVPAALTASSPSLRAALERVEREGYLVVSANTYREEFPLRVLLGMKIGSATGTTQMAFFFWNDRYLGTDTANSSAGIGLRWQTSDTVALEYTLYRPDDPMCCPTGGSVTVSYHWDGSRLMPLDPIPSDDVHQPLSRR